MGGAGGDGDEPGGEEQLCEPQPTLAVQECPYKFWVELDHGTEFVDDNQQSEPAAETPFRVTFGDGSVAEGALDKAGFKRFDGIPDGPVTVEYEPMIDEEVAELQKQLKAFLDELLAVEQAEYAAIEKKLKEARVFGLEFPGSNALAKNWMYEVAKLKGFANGVVGLLEAVWNVAKGTGVVLWEVSKRLNPITAPQEFAKDIEALKQTYEDLKRFANEDLEAYVVLLGDPKTYKLLFDFAGDYLKAQHTLEVTEVGGEVAFDIVLGLVTGGAGAARHAAKLKKIKKLLDKLVDAFKRKKRRRRIKVDRPNRRIVTRVELRKIKCFCPFGSKKFKKMSPHERKKYLKEYAKQVQRQQDAINAMKVNDYKAARDAFEQAKNLDPRSKGRNPAADAAQREARKDLRDEIKAGIATAPAQREAWEKLRNEIKAGIMEKMGPDGDLTGVDKKAGERAAEVIAGERADDVMKHLNALHEPDMATGGWHKPKPTRHGDAGVNQSIGPSWNQHDRLKDIDDQVAHARRNGMGGERMNIRLTVCSSKKACP
jgi:hypothetical protein